MCLKSCKGCPINITTEQGEKNSEYCLPSYGDAVKWFQETGKVWACHANPKKACDGFLIRAKYYGIEIPIDEKTVLITEQTTLEQIYEII
ncbi:MAG: hypothetical protein V4547_16520 [Bacteroidota bacterium]